MINYNTTNLLSCHISSNSNVKMLIYMVLSTRLRSTHIVGTYSPGNELVVYDINIHVLPTEPSPTTTHLMSLSVFAIPLFLSYF